jgi:cytochrome c-type biogenesis protein
VAETIQAIVFDANVLVAALIAFTAGFVSFASPCVIPLVPGYLSYMAGLSGDELTRGGLRVKSRVLAGSSLFVLGFAIPFTMLGFAVGALNILERSTVAQVLMGGVVVVFGVLMMRGSLMRELRLFSRFPDAGVMSALPLGFVFGVGWTPCLGPAAGAILTMSANVTQGVSGRGAFLGFVYAVGLGAPFIVFGLLFHRLGGALAFLKRRSRTIQIVGGALLVVVGLAIATGAWDALMVLLRPLIRGFETPL